MICQANFMGGGGEIDALKYASVCIYIIAVISRRFFWLKDY